jgi:Relaxase/Mobilisation nuclease domain
MIVKGRCRANGSQLASYLMSEKNTAVKILDIRGTVASTLNPMGLRDALNEMDALGTLADGKKNIFHAVINPNQLDRMSREDWQAAITKTEKALGLEGQPRVIVAHTYQGKEHLHLAWSRVDMESWTPDKKCKLISDSFCNLKMVQAAREIEMERGLLHTPDRNRNQRAAALNKILGEKKHEVDQSQAPAQFEKIPHRQRAKEIERFQLQRSSKSETTIKRDIASAWHQSLNGEEFRNKLQRAGLRLVRGKRGAVVMDEGGRIHSPARYIEGARVPDINAKCKDILSELPSEIEARNHQRNIQLAPATVEQLVKSKLVWEFANDPIRQQDHGPEPF